MNLRDEIAEALRKTRTTFKDIKNLGRDRDVLLAQAAIDVVELRLLSEDAIKVARVASGLGFGEASDVIGETWQAVKGENND